MTQMPDHWKKEFSELPEPLQEAVVKMAINSQEDASLFVSTQIATCSATASAAIHKATNEMMEPEEPDWKK